MKELEDLWNEFEDELKANTLLMCSSESLSCIILVVSLLSLGIRKGSIVDDALLVKVTQKVLLEWIDEISPLQWFEILFALGCAVGEEKRVGNGKYSELNRIGEEIAQKSERMWPLMGTELLCRSILARMKFEDELECETICLWSDCFVKAAAFERNVSLMENEPVQMIQRPADVLSLSAVLYHISKSLRRNQSKNPVKQHRSPDVSVSFLTCWLDLLVQRLSAIESCGEIDDESILNSMQSSLHSSNARKVDAMRSILVHSAVGVAHASQVTEYNLSQRPVLEEFIRAWTQVAESYRSVLSPTDCKILCGALSQIKVFEQDSRPPRWMQTLAENA
uniref:Uncharacterized protein n=1 Tax=Timspurckia oligopyrenoides TaxID=708627 RepID=A0A7S1ES74_9RHOD